MKRPTTWLIIASFLATSQGATAAEATAATVKVHIDSPVAAELRRRAANGASFVHACDAPCDQDMPISDDYILVAAGSRTTGVRLAGQEGETVTIQVKAPSEDGKVGGLVMMASGAIGLLVGGTLDLAGALAMSLGNAMGGGAGGGDVVLGVGVAITSVGLVLGVGGAFVFVKSGTTDVTTALSVRAAAAASDDRFLRAPGWRTPSALPRSAQGPVMQTLPIFSRSF
jgi:hypothetical protein